MRHVKINGIWYRLAEDAEGQHYAHNREPLRPPNAQLVQGDTTDFQLRPDSLLWRITDWSGGEGQLKWTTPDASRSYLLQGVDPFSRPGSLQLGYLESLIVDSTANTTFINVLMASAIGELYFIRANGGNTEWATWDATNEYIGAWTVNNSFGVLPSASAGALVGDAENLYVWNDASDYVVVFDGTTVTTLNDQIDNGSGERPGLAILGSYLYALLPRLGTLYEVSKLTANTTTPEVPLYEFTSGSNLATYDNPMVVGDGKLYFFTRQNLVTTIHEVVPSSAAGAGYGRVLTELAGFRAESIWFSGGTLFLMGTDGHTKSTTPVGIDRQIFYIDPQGQYGTLGSVRGLVRSPSDHGVPDARPATSGGFPATPSKLGRVGIALPPTTEDQAVGDVYSGVFELDTVTGGYAALGRAPTLSQIPEGHLYFVFFDQRYFLSMGNPSQIVSWDTQAFTAQVGVATSPAHDFNLASTKILDTIEVSCEPLPASNKITIGYSLDGATWVDTDVVTATGATSGSLQVSTDSSTKTFNNLQIRVKLTGSGGTSPVVRSIDTFARVNRKINTWDLLLDISDDSAPQGYSGQQILDNLLAVGDNTVIDFVDRYGSHIHDSGGDQYDVVIDAMSAVLDQPGEGIVAIRILETI